MGNEGIDARRSTAGEIDRALVDAHERTWALLGDLTADQWRVPYHQGINPPLWEYAHIAWFTEWWVLRDGYWNERADDGNRDSDPCSPPQRGCEPTGAASRSYDDAAPP